MPRGSHLGRAQKRSYTNEYYRLPAILFKQLLKSNLGHYKINLDYLSEEHNNLELVETANKVRIAKFHINNQTLEIALIQDDSSASNKLYITCPYCQTKRQHLYVIKNSYACRECLGLHYKVQAERPKGRLMRHIRKKRKSIWGADWSEINNMFIHPSTWGKPKGLHWNTFNKATNELNRLEDKFWPMVELDFDKKFGRKN